MDVTSWWGMAVAIAAAGLTAAPVKGAETYPVKPDGHVVDDARDGSIGLRAVMGGTYDDDRQKLVNGQFRTAGQMRRATLGEPAAWMTCPVMRSDHSTFSGCRLRS